VIVLDPISTPGFSYPLSFWLFRPKEDETTASCPVFGKGFLDLIDDVFWNLPFSGIRQSKRVRQQFNVTEELWNTRKSWIRAEHRLPNAREELERLWKERIANHIASRSGDDGAALVEDPADRLPVEEEDG
jgi:hypothetical protein